MDDLMEKFESLALRDAVNAVITVSPTPVVDSGAFFGNEAFKIKEKGLELRLCDGTARIELAKDGGPDMRGINKVGRASVARRVWAVFLCRHVRAI